MGGGKGSVDRWVAVVKPGRVLFEVSGIERGLAHEALRLASHKLPVSTTMISRGDGQMASE
jgi:large subunit ribosomal protein L16